MSKSWTHIVRINPDHHVYCRINGDTLVTLDGRTVVAKWDREWRNSDGSVTNFYTREACREYTQRPKPHRVTHWGPDEDGQGCYPWLIENAGTREEHISPWKFPKPRTLEQRK